MKGPDRFHFYFAAIAMIWFLVAAYLLREVRYESYENYKLRAECGLR